MDTSFSFVVPVYNTAENYLIKCVNSCLAQQDADVEVILVDDGSKEEFAVCCDKVSMQDKRVRVIYQKNAGVSAARNRGIQEASGDWVICVDSDDWVEPTLCENLKKELEKNSDIDFVLFTLMREFESASAPISGMYNDATLFSGGADMIRLQKDVLEHPLQNNILVFPYCKAVKKEALIAAQPVFPVGVAMCEDVLSAFKLFGYVKKGVYIDKQLYHYRQLSTSAVYKYRDNADQEQLLLLQSLSEMINALPNPEIYQKGFKREVFYAAQRVFSQKLFHRDSGLSMRQKRKKCLEIFETEPFFSGLKDVDVDGLSLNHRIKCFLLKNRFYACCSLLYQLYYKLPGKSLN